MVCIRAQCNPGASQIGLSFSILSKHTPTHITTRRRISDHYPPTLYSIMHTYFNINYEFDRNQVHKAIACQIARHEPGYICVADGVVMNTANRNRDYLEAVNGGMFSVCDSSYVPLYLHWIYRKDYRQYCGCEIFCDIISSRKYRMAFLGTSQDILDALKKNLMGLNSDVDSMLFYELPFKNVDGFDYPAIARMLAEDGADIIWVALGAPKQEFFMHRLKPHLNHGVMIAVGAAFKFMSGLEIKRAPQWMVKNHLEFIYRIFSEPKKQLKRCGWIIATLPSLLISEYRQSRSGK